MSDESVENTRFVLHEQGDGSVCDEEASRRTVPARGVALSILWWNEGSAEPEPSTTTG